MIKQIAKISGLSLLGLSLLYVCYLMAKTSTLGLLLGIGLGVLVIGVLLFEEKISEFPIFDLSALIKMAAVIIASIATYFLQRHIGTILSASLIGLVGAMLFGDLDDPIYVGAFVGMATLFTNTYLFIGVALLASLMYILLENQLSDLGGKLGSIAFIGGLIVSLFFTYYRNPYTFLWYQMLTLMGVSIISALLTYFLAKYLENTILASAFIGLIFGALALFIDASFMDTIALVGYGATFIGCQKRYKPYYMIISSVLFVVIYRFSYVVGGIGGGLGMGAFLSLLPIILGHHLIDYFKKEPISTHLNR